MAALLMVFVLLLAGTMLRIGEAYQQQSAAAKELKVLNDQYATVSTKYAQVVQAYHDLQDSLYEELVEEFGEDLAAWRAEIDRTSLSVRFSDPTVLFAQGQDTVSPRFIEILQDFFPRYIAVLSDKKYRTNIEEIRIEGHTSSEWEVEGESQDSAYFNNMALSQNRTRRVLQECLEILTTDEIRKWTQLKITANGLSSSKLILQDGVEDKVASRRVEFRVRTDAETRITEIMSVINQSPINKPEDLP